MIGDGIVAGILVVLFGGIALSNLVPWWRKRKRQRAADYAERRNCLIYQYKLHPERFQVGR